MAYAAWGDGGKSKVTSAKNKPASITGFIPFLGKNGGYHPVKVKMILLTEYDPIYTLGAAERFVMNFRNQYVMQIVKWNYSSGTLRGYLVYGYDLDSARKRGKPGWTLRH
jgi:hypothetical protein